MEFMHKRMNTEEQQLFVNSFKLYLDYGRDDAAFVVDLDHVWEWMGFSRVDPLKRLLKKTCTIEIDYVERNTIDSTTDLIIIDQLRLAPPAGGASLPQHGGHNKLKTLMTVKTFKKLCMKAGTEKADKVREYYLTMEEILHAYTEQCLIESKQQLTLLGATMKEVKQSAEWERHNALLAGYSNVRLVYILFITRLSESKFVIKIGSTSDLRERVNKINSAMGTTVKVLEVFPCGEHFVFEKKVHEIFQSIRYNELINDKVYSTETFLVENDKKLRSIKLRMQKEVRNFYHRSIEDQERSMRELELHNEKMRLQCVSDLLHIYKDRPTELANLLSTVLPQTTKFTQSASAVVKTSDDVETPPPVVNNDQTTDEESASVVVQTSDVDTPPPVVNNDQTTDEEDSAHEEVPFPVPTHAVTRKAVGPKVQIYNPSDLTKVVKVFEGLFQATIEMESASFSSIKYAAKHKTIYKGYRWFLVDRDDLQPYASKDIGETTKAIAKTTGELVAMLNINTDLVEKVFNTQSEAGTFVSRTKACISLALRSGSTTAGYHWQHWDTLAPYIQNEYLSRASLPGPVPNPKGTRVQRIDMNTGAVLEEYTTLVDVYKKSGITPKCIKKAFINKTPCKGFLWNMI